MMRDEPTALAEAADRAEAADLAAPDLPGQSVAEEVLVEEVLVEEVSIDGMCGVY
jgi:mycofactocin precursor